MTNQTTPTDADLLEAQARYAANPAAEIWALTALEKAHLDAQPALAADDKQKQGTIVLDREGDAWRWGRTRWSCLTPLDGVRVTNVGRLPQSTLISQYGPLKVIGDNSGFRYKTIRGRR